MQLCSAAIPSGHNCPSTSSFLLFLFHSDFVHLSFSLEDRKIIFAIRFSPQYVTKPEKVQQARVQSCSLSCLILLTDS